MSPWLPRPPLTAISLLPSAETATACQLVIGAPVWVQDCADAGCAAAAPKATANARQKLLVFTGLRRVNY